MVEGEGGDGDPRPWASSGSYLPPALLTACGHPVGTCYQRRVACRLSRSRRTLSRILSSAPASAVVDGAHESTEWSMELAEYRDTSE